MKRYFVYVCGIMFGFILALITINNALPSLEFLNVKMRNFLVHRSFHKFSFNEQGIPEQTNPRIGKYISPFYVVHFGLMYSESCRSLVDTSKLHWFKDQTLKYWHGASPPPTLYRFKATLEWLLKSVDKKTFGVAHYLYNFDWPYPGYSKGVIKAPWWSGLTDSYAIILLLRGYDCFHDVRYILLAKDLYTSVLTPFSHGGSLVYWEGLPWIEEYVDPTATPEQLTHVLNGMIYAYYGILAFERARNIKGGHAEALLTSISKHIDVFDMGYWSYYDGKKTPANVKYHRINWALTLDPRITSQISSDLKKRWEVGVRFPVLYFVYGQKTVAYFHLLLEFVLMTMLYVVFTVRLLSHVCNTKRNPNR